MDIKICKYRRIEFKNRIDIEIKMTLLGFLLRNNWVVVKNDFESDYINKWIPCYMNLSRLIKNKFSFK